MATPQHWYAEVPKQFLFNFYQVCSRLPPLIMVQQNNSTSTSQFRMAGLPHLCLRLRTGTATVAFSPESQYLRL